ncbi:hypothetical protein Hanom_Chr07g00636831 [Helianthus anomalus]
MERVAWLRMIGIPIHLFDPEVMIQIGEQFGKVLHSPKFVEEDSDVSVCSVAVLVGDVGRINGSVKIFWNKKSYRIWVEEELEVWVPDCLHSSRSDDAGPVSSSPVVNMQSSGRGGYEESLERGENGEAEEFVGINVDSPNASPVPMQEERESGRGLEEHVGLHGNLRSHNSEMNEVRNKNMDKGDNIGADSQEWGQSIRAGGSNSGGPNQGFNVGNVGAKRFGFKHPRILAQSRKVKGKSSSPPVLRPFKRSRQQMDEEFSFPNQIPASAPVEPFEQERCRRIIV